MIARYHKGEILSQRIAYIKGITLSSPKEGLGDEAKVYQTTLDTTFDLDSVINHEKIHERSEPRLCVTMNQN